MTLTRLDNSKGQLNLFALKEQPVTSENSLFFAHCPDRLSSSLVNTNLLDYFFSERLFTIPLFLVSFFQVTV